MEFNLDNLDDVDGCLDDIDNTFSDVTDDLGDLLNDDDDDNEATNDDDKLIGSNKKDRTDGKGGDDAIAGLMGMMSCEAVTATTRFWDRTAAERYAHQCRLYLIDLISIRSLDLGKALPCPDQAVQLRR